MLDVNFKVFNVYLNLYFVHFLPVEFRNSIRHRHHHPCRICISAMSEALISCSMNVSLLFTVKIKTYLK